MGKKPAVKRVAEKDKPADETGKCNKQPVIAFYSDKEGHPYREFSNFFRHQRPFEFSLPAFARKPGFPESVWCSFSEKAIMVIKAALMEDREVFDLIDKAQAPDECKKLGRGIRNFRDDLWQNHLEETAFEVVRQKFAADKTLRDVLLSTGDAILVEAAPNDRIWGVGLNRKDSRVKDPSQWQGRNILGYALMQARDHLRSASAFPARRNATQCEDEATRTPCNHDEVKANSTAPSSVAAETAYGLNAAEVAAGRERSNGEPQAVEDKLETTPAPFANGSEESVTGVDPSETPSTATRAFRLGEPSIPFLSAEEAARITMRMEDVETSLRPVLDEFGCAIVTGVACPEECKRLENLFSQDLAEVIDRSASQKAGAVVNGAAEKAAQDPKAWPKASMKLLGKLDRCQLRGLPHGRFAWESRLLPNVKRCYEVIHETQDLISSCDNAFFATPAAEDCLENRSWPHVDHNCHDKRFYDDNGIAVSDWEVYQGLLYVWSSEQTHASTTVVLPCSHLDIYIAMMSDPKMVDRGRRGEHFSQISSLCEHELAARLREQWRVGARRVPVPEGALLLWSSKTLHQGWSGGPRLAQPVCWEPAGRRDDAAYDRKLRLAALGLPSTHWASLGIPHTLVKPSPCEPTAAVRAGSSVVLPARASVCLSSLRDGVSVAQMWSRLQDTDWNASMSAEMREFVEESLSERVLAAL